MLTQNVEETAAIPDPDDPNPVEPTDRELLMRFSRHRQEDAFSQLVDRHATMVLSVCRRILRDHHEAEDAFQATFLILAQQAHKSHWSNSVAAWLCKVAYRTAMKAAKKRYRQWDHPKMVDDIESTDAEQWAGCVAGALPVDEYLGLIRDAGFVDVTAEYEPNERGITSAYVSARRP